MPPWSEVLAFLREFGLPLTILVVFGYLVISRMLVTRGEVTQMRKDYESRLIARDQRADDFRRMYEQERQDRIVAYDRLNEATDSIKNIVANIDDLTKEVIRASK